MLVIYFPTYIKLQDVSRHCPSASPNGKALKAVYGRKAADPPPPRLDSGGSAGDGRRAESRRVSPAGGRDADNTALSLIELNTCAPPLADNCRI